ncbi:hypothetical protein EV567_0533 [Streptomyces sp. BK239]|nr:hypothetical protein EV567_0533 [Streptomyces sp. BK239]
MEYSHSDNDLIKQPIGYRDSFAVLRPSGRG